MDDGSLDPILNGEVDRKEELQESGAIPAPRNEQILRVLKKRLGEAPAGQPNYEQDPIYRPATNLREARTTSELMHFIELEKATGKNIEVDARILVRCPRKNKRGAVLKIEKMNFEKLQEAYRAAEKFKEWGDVFDTDGGSGGGGGSLVGNDNVPLVGGPFAKQLYLQDYLRMHMEAFFAFHHDPVGKRICDTIRDFTIGKGVKVTIESDDPRAVPLWKAFERVNKIEEFDEMMALELCIYGELLQWWLPDNTPYISYDTTSRQRPKPGKIPRVRLVDPSCIWEIVTYPEDIQRVLFYQWVSQTQYQVYTGKDKGDLVPGQKFIMQQIPAEQIDHVKINCVSNEKRGRSELYSIMGYLKRLRDSVDYSLVSLQKASAWSVDTEVDGSQDDIDAYVQSQRELGTIPQAGSEFVHSSKVKRKYAGNEGAGGSSKHDSWEWCLSMIAIGSGIPISYLGTHLAGGASRASAMVSTEPVAKKFDYFQTVLGRIKREQVHRVMDANGIDNYEANVMFPEIINQDRSAKLKDLGLAEDRRWISPKRAANMAVKELDVDDYDYDDEQGDIEEQLPDELSTGLLTAPGKVQPTASPAGDTPSPIPAGPTASAGVTPQQGPTAPGAGPKPLAKPKPAIKAKPSAGADVRPPKPGAVTKNERRDLKMGRGA